MVGPAKAVAPYEYKSNPLPPRVYGGERVLTPGRKDPTRVAFVGRMGTGKTTMADEVCAHYPDVHKISFASRVKRLIEARELKAGQRQNFVSDTASMVLGAHDGMLKHANLVKGWMDALDRLDKGEITERQFLQIVGTDVGRSTDKMIWIRPVIDKIRLDSPRRGYVVDDVRFVNEAEALKDEGFFIVRLEVPEELRHRRLYARDGRLPDDAIMQHASESEIDEIPVDFTLRNDRDLDLVKADLLSAIEAHKSLVSARKESPPYDPVSKSEIKANSVSLTRLVPPDLSAKLRELRRVYVGDLESLLREGVLTSLRTDSEVEDPVEGTITHMIEYTERTK